MTNRDLHFDSQRSGLIKAAADGEAMSSRRFVKLFVVAYCSAIADELRQRELDINPRAGATFNDTLPLDGEIGSHRTETGMTVDYPWATPMTVRVDVSGAQEGIIMSPYHFEAEDFSSFEEKVCALVSIYAYHRLNSTPYSQ